MVKRVSEMTRADWLTRRWINTTPPGSREMMFTDGGDFPQEQRMALLRLLHARLGAEPATSDEPVAR
jgi:hypothetical protein